MMKKSPDEKSGLFYDVNLKEFWKMYRILKVENGKSLSIDYAREGL